MKKEEPFLASTVGQKLVMAATGVILFGFVVGHMVGNLQVYLGPEVLNHYGVLLRELGHGAGIWIARGTLVVCTCLHVWAATVLTLTSWKARPQAYRVQRWREANYASRTMRWSGPLLAAFVGFHLAHLTWGSVHPHFREGDIYQNLVTGFSVWPVSAFYIAAMLALGLHMYHGVWSMLQTLGLSHPRYNRLGRIASAVFTLVVVLGNISIPVAVLGGWVR